MDVVSICPLQVGSMVWQPRPSLWVLTVACRATFYLLPGPARLASRQEPVHALDQHRDDDPARSLVYPSDLAPFKPRADVMLVGSAFAPRQEPARSLLVRLTVGAIDKSIDVFGARSMTRAGGLVESPFVSMPLCYEQAAGGPGTSNPVGLGDASLPNLQAPDQRPPRPGERIGPIGFGPIAPGWPGRVERLGRHAAGWSHGAWHERPLPEDVDRAYFNAAPPDQQLEALRGDERVVLQNLHPSYPELAMTLPGLQPRVTVRRPGAAPEEVAMTCDTLWIDNTRCLCTLTWRGRVMLEHPEQTGRVAVTMEQPDRAPGADAPKRPLTEDFTLAPLPERGPALPFVVGAAGLQDRSPVPIAPLGPAVCATVAFRTKGSLRVAAIVKATFQLVPGGPMIEADPVVTEGRLELAPYLGRADVVLHGSAHAPAGRPAGPLAARLLVAREGGHTLLNKSVTAPGPGPLAALAPIAPSSPARRMLLGTLDPALLDARVVEIPEGFAWAYFHAAPEDQRIEFLRGDEWIVFDGMHAEMARVQSRLPGATAEARVYGPSPELASGRAITLVADTLIIDAERLRCSLIWRGNWAVDDEDALGRLRVLAGVHLPGRPLTFPASYAAAASPAPAPAPRAEARARSPLSQEMTLAPLPDAPAPATPFEPGARTGRAALTEEMTLAPLPDADLRAPATPFVQGGPLPLATPPASVWSSAARPSPRSALAEEMTLAPLPDADVRAPATPFERPVVRAWDEPPPPVPVVVAPPALIVTAPEPPPVVAPPPMPPPEPPAAVAPPEPPEPGTAAPEAPAATPENKLGPQFAAAMARARELSKRPR